MAEDSINDDGDASVIGAEWWGSRLSKSIIASIFAPMKDVQHTQPAQHVPSAYPSTTNAVNNNRLHYCIMVLLEGKYGKIVCHCSLCIS